VKELREVFADEYKSATSAVGKAELARTLMRQSKSGSPTHVYARQTEVIRLAAETGEFGRIETALMVLNEGWTIDVWSMRMDAMQDVSKNVKGMSDNRSFYVRLVQWSLEIQQGERADLATRIAPLLVRAATETRDPDLRKDASRFSVDLRKFATARQTVDRAIETLKTQPDDAAANLLYGKYLCTRGNWGEGIPLLGKCGVQAIADLVQRDLKLPTAAEEQLALADAYWNAAETDRNGLADLLRRRGVYWYTSAFPNLTGLPKRKAEMRIEEFQAQGGGK
jgi:hypothetical protein